MRRRAITTATLQEPSSGSVEAQFQHALDSLTAQLKQDKSILAAILCGSLSHDVVWRKSDIDLALVTIDEKPRSSHVSLNVSGVIVHAFLMPRTEFRQTVEGSTRKSFIHSLLAKGRLLFSHDPTIESLCARLNEIGERDTRRQLLAAGSAALLPLDKARKWLVTRGDLDYTALWLLYAATPLARIEILNARLLADREVLPQALRLNPDLFGQIYTAMLNTRKTAKSVTAALDAADACLARHAPAIFGPVLDYLKDVGEARSCSEIDDHFHRHMDLEGVSLVCEYLAAQGLIAKVTAPVQLTRRSNVQLEELAFIHLGGPPDDF